MRVHATLHGFTPRERDVDVDEGTTADGLVRALGIEPELVLVFRGGDPIPGDAALAEGDRVRVLRVVSGGSTRRFNRARA